MAAILFNGAEPFKQIDKFLLIEGPVRNLAKIGQAVSEKEMFKDYTILYMYKAQEQGQITSGDACLSSFLLYRYKISKIKNVNKNCMDMKRVLNYCKSF